MKKLRTLSEDELIALPWLPAAVAKAVYVRLHGLEAPAARG